ncbi:secretion protein HlyD [soil metagenome]
MKRLVPVILLALIAGAYIAYQRYLSHRPFEWAGTVESRTISVGSRTGGRVAKVLVQEGDQFKACQVLVELEHGDLDAQRAGASAVLAQAAATLDKLKAGARPEEIDQANARTAQASAQLRETRSGSRVEEVAAAEAHVVQAQAVVDKAQLDSDRTHTLVSKRAVAQAEADAADTQLKTAKAERDALQRVLDQLRSGARVEEKAAASARLSEAQAAAKLVSAGARVEDLRAAQAMVDSAQARVDQLDVTVSELQIKAPVAARVEALQLRPGDILGPNATAASLLEDGQLYVRLYVPETQLGRISVGQDVPIKVDSFARTFKGKVEHINAQGEYSPRNLQTADERADQVFAARIGLLEGKDQLRAGMAATIEVEK